MVLHHEHKGQSALGSSFVLMGYFGIIIPCGALKKKLHKDIYAIKMFVNSKIIK